MEERWKNRFAGLLAIVLVFFALIGLVDTLVCLFCRFDTSAKAAQIESVEEIELPVLEVPDLAPEQFDTDTIEALAKCVYGEAGNLSKMERAAVVWCVLNYIDTYDSADVMAQLNYPNRFQGYRYNNPVTEENLALVRDVITRWQIEKSCVGDVGRVLPKEYLYFYGDGQHNWFRNQFVGGDVWDWSLPNPYEE